MSYTWSHFFIAISVLMVLYYGVIYVLFFLRKAPAHNSTEGKNRDNNTNSKSTKKNNQNTNINPITAATTLIETKVIGDDYFKTEDDFLINESINQNYVNENGLLQNSITSNTNNGSTHEVILNEFDKNNLSQITISENFVNEDTLVINDSHTTSAQNTEATYKAEIRETTSNIIEENININIVNEPPIITDTSLYETKKTLATGVPEEKYITPNLKPQQMQSLLHLIQKK
jgi:hypothetical protein